MYSDILIVQVYKLLKMAFDHAELDAEKDSTLKLVQIIVKETGIKFDERNIKNLLNCFRSVESFEDNKTFTKEIVAGFVLFKRKDIAKIKMLGGDNHPEPIYWQMFKKLYGSSDKPATPIPVEEPKEHYFDNKPIPNYLLGTWWRIYNRSPVTRDIHAHLMYIHPTTTHNLTRVITYPAGKESEAYDGFAYTDDSGNFILIDQVVGKLKRRQIHLKIKNAKSSLPQLMWGQANLISDSPNVISYMNILEGVGIEKPKDWQPTRYKYDSELYHQLPDALKWYFLSTRRSYLKMPEEGFYDWSLFEQLVARWQKSDFGESYEDVFQEIIPIPKYFENTTWKLYNKSRSGSIHENILHIKRTKIGKLTKVTLASASEEYENYEGYCRVSHDNHIIVNLNTIPSRHKECHLKIKCGKGVKPLAMIGQANYLMSMIDDICTDNIVLEKIEDAEALPQRHSKNDYAHLPSAVSEYFKLNIPFRLISFDVISNMSELRKCVRMKREEQSPFNKLLHGYYKDYWVYYQYNHRNKGWLTDELELNLSPSISQSIIYRATDEFLLEQAFQSRGMISLFFRKQYNQSDQEALTLEFWVRTVFEIQMECFTGTLTGLRDILGTHITVPVLMVLKTVENFKRQDDERVHKFFEKQTVKCIEPLKLTYFSLEDI